MGKSIIHLILISIINLLTFLLIINLLNFIKIYWLIILIVLVPFYYLWVSSNVVLSLILIFLFLLLEVILFISVTLFILKEGIFLVGGLLWLLLLLRFMIVSFVFSLMAYYNDCNLVINYLVPEFNVDRKDFPKDIELYCSKRYIPGHKYFSIPYKYFKSNIYVYLDRLKYIVFDLDINLDNFILVDSSYYDSPYFWFKNCILEQFSYNEHSNFTDLIGMDRFYRCGNWVTEKINDIKPAHLSGKCSIVKVGSFNSTLEGVICNNHKLYSWLNGYLHYKFDRLVYVTNLHVIYDSSYKLKLLVEYNYSKRYHGGATSFGSDSAFSLLPSMPPVVGVYLDNGSISGVECLVSNIEYEILPAMLTPVEGVNKYKGQSHLTLVNTSSNYSVRIVFLTLSPYIYKV